MRHNDHASSAGGGMGRPIRFRSSVIMALLLGVLFFSADTVLSQTHRAAKKNDKKAAEQKKKESQKANEMKSAENPAVEEAAKNNAAGDESAKDQKNGKDEPKEGDLNMGDYNENDFRPQVEEESTAWLFFKTIFVLGSIVGGFYFFFKFVTKKTGIQLFGQDVVKVLWVVPLGQNKYIQVVDMAGKVMVLGITDNSINVLMEIHERDEIDRIRLLSSKTVAQKVEGFQEFLAAQIGRVIGRMSGLRHRGAPTVVEEKHVAGDMDYLREHRKRLRDLNGDGGES